MLHSSKERKINFKVPQRLLSEGTHNNLPPDSLDLSVRRKAQLTSSQGGAKMDPFRAKASATVDRATRGNTLRISTRHSSGYLQASARTDDQRFVSSQRASSSISHCRGIRLCSLLFVIRGQESSTNTREPGLHLRGETCRGMGAGDGILDESRSTT